LTLSVFHGCIIALAKDTTEVESSPLNTETGGEGPPSTSPHHSNNFNLPSSTTVSNLTPNVISGSRKFYYMKTRVTSLALAKNEILLLQRSRVKVCVSVEQTKELQISMLLLKGSHPQAYKQCYT